MSSDLLKAILNNASTTEAIQQMRQENEEKAEQKRLELAGAITRLVINDALRDAKSRQQVVNQTKGENQA